MEKTKQSSNVKIQKICVTGLMAAVICVFTAFVKFNTGINDGYLHFGDSMIYLAGTLLGPWASLAAAIGGALADIISGAPQWAPATAVIKALNAVPFILMASAYKKKHNKRKIVSWYTVPMVIVSGLITIFGYLLAEGIMYSFSTAWLSAQFSVIQAIGSAIIFIIVGLALDGAKITRFIKW